MPLDTYAVLEELREQERIAATRSVLDFGMRINPRHMPVKHMIVMGRAIDQWMTSPNLQRLVIMAPPRHGKSFYSSWYAPATILGRYPNSRVMHMTHTEKFARIMGRRIRNTIMRNDRWPFQNVEVLPDRASNDSFELSNGSSYVAFGAGGSPTGNPADYLICDDVIKGRDVAFSDTERDNIWENMQTDVWSRLEGPQKELHLLTRWHEDDYLGRILPEDFDGSSGWYSDRETGERYYVLAMPAICEHDNDPCGRQKGEWLWPEEHGTGKKIEFVRKRGGYVWSALYQQRPSPDEGLFFDTTKIRYYDPERINIKELAIYGSSDYAVTEEAGAPDPDYTVHTVFGVDRFRNVYVLDMWRGRTKSDKWVDALILLVKKWRPMFWAEEAGQIKSTIEPFLKREFRQHKAFTARRQFTSSKSKEARAQIMQALIERGKVFLPKPIRAGVEPPYWVELLVKEMRQFPGGKHDDMVDTMTLFGRLLNALMEGRKEKKKKKAATEPHETLEQWYADSEAELLEQMD